VGTNLLERTAAPLKASALGMTAAAACMALLALPQGVTWPVGAAGWLGVAYTGLVTTSLAYLLFAWGARRLTPTAAVVGIMVEPLVATLLAAWLFASPIAARQWLGALLLAAALVPLTRRAQTRAEPVPPVPDEPREPRPRGARVEP